MPSGATVPAGELTERFSRSPGPGGQSVNTSDSRVELLFDPAASSAFTEPQRRRILAALPSGPVSVTASEHRSQLRNRAAARERLVGILREAVAPPPPPRRATKPTKGSQRRRIEAKKQRGQTKSLRGRVTDS
ncbi:MAG: alternative ribosome rescue aminoacyl-tRNA hydrolase ArfB [Propionibacteriales bacterium]|nr:alternative ribosome rescue aminoacyl-tRNA hydrolase ArfB [Propionibacteriales bacterium]